jgi:alpha-tubulin suppressor-like RCC1 family protein
LCLIIGFKVFQLKNNKVMKKLIVFIAFIILVGFVNAQVISCGYEHTLSLCHDSTAQSWGASNGSNTPVQVMGLTGITAVSGGGLHSLFLKNNNTAWSCGTNSMGQLGNGTTNDEVNPIQVLGLSGIIAVAGGGNHSLFLTKEGIAWACGQNCAGQLVDSTQTNRLTPVQVHSITGIIKIAGGFSHSFFLRNDNLVWGCGANGAGQLGDSTQTYRYTPVQVQGLTGIISMSAGSAHSLFLKNDGTVWACGDNTYGQLGDGTTTAKIKAVQLPLTGIIAISTKDRHSLFLKNDGTVWACGFNLTGQLGNDTTTGYNPNATPLQIPGLTGIIAIAAGSNHSVFLKNDGTLWACGLNSSGQLGDGTTIDRYTPVQVINLCKLASGIEEINNNAGNIKVYPNPASDVLTVSSGSRQDVVSCIEVFNLLGEKIYNTPITDNRLPATINVADFPSGVYIVQAKTENGVFVSKFIKE